MTATVARLTAHSLLGRRRTLVLLVLPSLLLALSVTVRAFAGVGEAAGIGLLGGFALGTIVPLLALIAGTGAIGPEIDDGSVVYLLAKPLRRSMIVLAKLAVSVGVVTAVAAVPTLVAGLILWGTADGVAVAYGTGALVAGVAYCAVFLLLAVMTRSAVVVGLLYALVWESLIGGFVPGAQVLSIQQWALAVTEWILGADAQHLGVSAAVTVGTAVPCLVAVTVGAAVYAGHRLRALRVSSSDS